MQVLSGKLLLDLQIKQTGIKSKIKRNMEVTWRNYHFRPVEEGQVDLTLETDALSRDIVQEWQNRWDTNKRGRDTFNFISEVDFITGRSWFKLPR